MRTNPSDHPPTRLHRVLLVAEERFGVVRDFLRGFYGTVRPKRDWLILQTRGLPEELEAVRDWRPDLAVLPTLARTKYLFEDLRIPRLFYMTANDPGEGPWFHPDEEAVGRSAAEHLLSAGYRSAACVYNPDHHGSSLRMRGFTDRLLRENLAPLLYAEATGKDRHQDARAFTAEDPELRNWLTSLPASTGIYAWSDSSALWIAECARQLGISIPDRLGLVGTDNQPDLCQRAWPALDSVMLPYAHIGKAVADWIHALESGGQPPAPAPFPVAGVFRRQSTVYQGAANPELATLFALLRSTPPADLSVPFLVDHMDMSRRTLERNVRKHCGQTLNHLIERQRLELAETLLSTTRRTVADIASACGFATTRSLELLFHKYHQTTPAAYAQLRQLS